MSSEVEPCVVWALRASLPFLAKLIEDLKNNDRVGPARLEKAVWQGRGATFRARTSQGNSKEVLGMAKVLSLEETAVQWCQIREGGR
jgi:hypothetical protein